MEKKLSITPVMDEKSSRQPFLTSIQGCLAALQTTKPKQADIMQQAKQALEMIQKMRSCAVHFTEDAPRAITLSEGMAVDSPPPGMFAQNGARVQPAPGDDQKPLNAIHDL